MKKYLKISENVTFESIEANVFILDTSNGEYYELSESASIIWKYIENDIDIEDIKSKLRNMFPNNKDIESDIDESVRDFIGLGLIEDN